MDENKNRIVRVTDNGANGKGEEVTSISKKSKIIIISSIIFILIIAIIATIVSIYLTSDIKVHLYISNQSPDDNPVNITILVDGNLKFNEECWVDNQHNSTHVEFSLHRGTHKIKAIESDHGIERIESFKLYSEKWIVVDYWYYSGDYYGLCERHFSISVYDSPVASV